MKGRIFAAGLTAPFLALVGSVIPWIRLTVRGHVEFCAGECNPRDWFDYAEHLGTLLSLGIPSLAICLVVKHLVVDHRCNKTSALIWAIMLACAIASYLVLAALREAFYARF